MKLFTNELFEPITVALRTFLLLVLMHSKLAYFDYNYCVGVYFKRIQASVYRSLITEVAPGRQEKLCKPKVFLSMAECVCIYVYVWDCVCKGSGVKGTTMIRGGATDDNRVL